MPDYMYLKQFSPWRVMEVIYVQLLFMSLSNKKCFIWILGGIYSLYLQARTQKYMGLGGGGGHFIQEQGKGLSGSGTTSSGNVVIKTPANF